MRNSIWKTVVVLASLLVLGGCEDQEDPPPADVAKSESAVIDKAVDTPTPDSGVVAQKPEDGVEPVPIDEKTGWPTVMVPPPKRAPEPVVEYEEEKVYLPSLDGAGGDYMVRRRPVVKANPSPSQRRPLRRSRHPGKKRLAKSLAQDGEPRIDPFGEETLRRIRDRHLPDFVEKPDNPPVENPKNSSVVKPRYPLVENPKNSRKFSTFAVDVDTGSYSLSIGRMRRGYPPRKDAIRVEEWLNTFYYDHEVPDGQDFSIAMEGAPNPFRPAADEHLLRINIAGKSVAQQERPAAHLTFVIDVSGSMFGPDKLDLIKESLTLLVSKLRHDDTVAIVTYAKATEVVLWPTSASERGEILGAISRLEPGGSTALDEGLKLGYGLAFRESHYQPGDIHRVVLMGDGRANVGSRDVESLLGPIQAAVDKGVTLSTIGFGAKAFNDELMEQLANRGNGNYAFIDSFRDARRVFGEQLCGTIHVIGKDAKIQVEFNLERVESWELIGYENRALETEDFRDDAVDAGEIGAGHQVTALYRVKLRDRTSGPIATTRFRWEDPELGEVFETEETLTEVAADLRQTSKDFKFAAAVAATADRFKDQTFTASIHAGLIAEIAMEGIGVDQPARKEFVDLLGELQPFMKKN